MIRKFVPAAAALVLALAAGPAAPQGYEVTDLGTLGGTSASAAAINNSAQITGSASTASSTDAFLWQNGTMADLGMTESFGAAISSNGYVAGYDYQSNGTHAFLFANGVLTDLGMLPGFSGGNAASGVNRLGQVVGLGTQGTGRGETSAGWIWQNGVYTNLGKVSPAAINDAGQILVDEFNASGYEVAVILQNGSAIATIDPAGSVTTVGDAINANGDVAGTFEGTAGEHAFLYHAGVVTDLGNLGFDEAVGTAVNIDDVVVGYASGYEVSSTAQAFVTVNGQMTNLNSLIDSNSGWLLKFATGINDAGQIVGYGTLNGNQQAFLLTPTSVPLAPATPTGLSAAAGNGQVSLSWSVAARASSYVVARSTDNIHYSAIASGVTGTSYTDKTVTNGTEYYYEVAAVNSAGQSPYSAAAAAIPNAPPPAPTNVSATAGRAEVTIKWTQPATSGFEYNLIYRSTSATGTFTEINSSTTGSYVDTSVTRRVKYYYYVTAVNSSGMMSAPSAIVSATPQ
jgi:probable HAF family extracellular repeat protein